MLEERCLYRVLKETWRSGGYEVAGTGDDVFLYGGAWCVKVRSDLLPRKILGLIVEHIEEVPRDAAWKVSKDNGAQSEVLDVAHGLLRNAQKLAESVTAPITRTKMNFDGYEVWQAAGTGEIRTMNPVLTRINDIDAGANLSGNAVIWESDASLTVVMAATTMEPNLKNVLEQVALTGENER